MSRPVGAVGWDWLVAGAFALAARQDAVLSRVQLSAGQPDQCSARLLIFDGLGHLVAQDSTSF